MRIGIDIDNVIANTFEDLAARFNQYVGKDLNANEVVDFMRREKFRMWGYWFVTWRESLLTRVSLIEGAKHTITNWYDDHEILLVTSRLPILNRQTKKWLNQHEIPYHKLHHSKEREKYKKAPNCDVFIEDNLEECEILADYCDRVYLMDHPWNRRPLKKDNIIRVTSWTELKEILS